MQLITQLQHAGKRDRQQFGNKAVNLGLLAKSGNRVPLGFILSTEAFTDFLGECEVSTYLKNVLAYNEIIAQKIREKPFSEKLKEAIEEAWRYLATDGSTIAVRSSSVAEDTGESSFAGIYSSYTDIGDLDEVYSAIKGCYTSLFTDKALDASLRSGLDPNEIKMAVIIQKYMPGTPSGVLFTADAVSMNEKTMVINAVAGPCSDFVDNLSESIQYYIDRDTGERIDNDRLYEDKFVHLNNSQILQLRESGLEIENTLGRYQDIEWTFADGALWVLQARPITTMKKKISPDLWDPKDGKTWHLSPYSHALSPLEQEAVERSLTGARAGAVKTANRGVGALYVNRRGHFYTRTEEIPDYDENLRNWSTYIGTLIDEGKNVFEDILAPQIIEWLRELDSYVNRELPAHEVADFLKASLEYAEWASEVHWEAVWGNCFLAECTGLPSFAEIYKDQVGVLSGAELGNLVSSTTLFSENRKALIRMGSMVRNRPVLKELFEIHSSNKIIMAHLEIMEEAAPLLAQMVLFLGTCWRYPCGTWRDPVGPILKETPEAIVGWIRSYHSISAEQHERVHQENQKRKMAIVGKLEDKFSGRGKAEFQKALELAEKAYRCRDDHAHYIDCTIHSYVRIAATKAGNILSSQGILNKPADVWLLRSVEIISCLNGESNVITAELLGHRNEEHRRNCSILPPATLGAVTSGQNAQSVEPEKDTKKEVEGKRELTGASGLATVVKGRIAVYREEQFEIREPSIVVLPDVRSLDIVTFIDMLTGIIVASGSPFSHIGIFARELQIPAIFNVKGAMELLQDGDEVEIDGTEEKVTILAQKP